jgi:hypothetical protein
MKKLFYVFLLSSSLAFGAILPKKAILQEAFENLEEHIYDGCEEISKSTRAEIKRYYFENLYSKFIDSAEKDVETRWAADQIIAVLYQQVNIAGVENIEETNNIIGSINRRLAKDEGQDYVVRLFEILFTGDDVDDAQRELAYAFEDACKEFQRIELFGRHFKPKAPLTSKTKFLVKDKLRKAFVSLEDSICDPSMPKDKQIMEKKYHFKRLYSNYLKQAGKEVSAQWVVDQIKNLWLDQLKTVIYVFGSDNLAQLDKFSLSKRELGGVYFPKLFEILFENKKTRANALQALEWAKDELVLFGACAKISDRDFDKDLGPEHVATRKAYYDQKNKKEETKE